MNTQERVNAEYLEYLKSEKWKQKARQRLEIDKYKVMNRVTNDQGRRGWRDIPYLPNIHTYSIDGEELERTKELI